MTEEKRGIIRRTILVFMASAFVAALIGIIVLSKLLFDVGVLCPFYELYHWNCPGCGGTRMAVSLIHLDLYQAFRWNSYVLVSLPFLVVIYVKQTYVYIRYNRLLDWIDKFLVLYVLGLLVFGIVRNIGIFTWLAPTLIN